MKNQENIPGTDGFTGAGESGLELLVMHNALRSLFDDENDRIPEEGEIDEEKDYELTGKERI